MSSAPNRESFLNKLKQSNELQITVTGRKTKKKFSTPVWFLLDREKILIVPTKGSANNWFKNLERDPQIELRVSDATTTSKAKLAKDPDQARQILDKLKAKYKTMWSDSYYSRPDAYVEIPL